MTTEQRHEFEKALRKRTWFPWKFWRIREDVLELCEKLDALEKEHSALNNKHQRAEHGVHYLAQALIKIKGFDNMPQNRVSALLNLPR